MCNCWLPNPNNNPCVLKFPPADLSDASNPARSARLNSGPAPGSLQTFILKTLATTWMKRNWGTFLINMVRRNVRPECWIGRKKLPVLRAESLLRKCHEYPGHDRWQREVPGLWVCQLWETWGCPEGTSCRCSSDPSPTGPIIQPGFLSYQVRRLLSQRKLNPGESAVCLVGQKTWSDRGLSRTGSM